MKQEEFNGIIRYLDHTIDNDRKIYRQVLKGRDYEAEMYQKAIVIANDFLKDKENQSIDISKYLICLFFCRKLNKNFRGVRYLWV